MSSSDDGDGRDGRDGRDELVERWHQVATEVLGDWYLRLGRQPGQWEPLPLELFPDAQLRSIATVANAGTHPDELVPALQRNGARELWPDAEAAIDLLLECQTRSNTAEAIGELRELFASRRFETAALLALSNLDRKGLAATLATLQEARELAEASSTDGFEALDDAAIMAPLQGRHWLCRDLHLTEPEEPVMLFGPPGRGKSWVAMDLAVAIATGTRFAGALSVRRGKVLYLDLEQGEYSMRHRIQALMGGRHASSTDNHLRPVILPLVDLGDPASESLLKRECSDHALCVVDSFAASHRLNEDKPEVGNVMVMLHRVSKSTGCAFVVVHHSRKRANDPNASNSITLDDLRGSGNLPAHCSAVWALQGKLAGDGEGAHLELLKTRVGSESRGYRMRLEPAADEGSFVTLTCEPWIDLPPPDDHKTAGVDAEVREFVGCNPGCSAHQIHAGTGRGRRTVSSALERLAARGLIRRDDSSEGSNRKGARWIARETGETAKGLAKKVDPQASLLADDEDDLF